jgi:hypothetical protein
MKKRQSNVVYGPGCHALTRRSLFAHGFFSIGGSIVTPSIVSMLSSIAKGEPAPQNCFGDSKVGRMVPLIVIDLVGGSNIAGTNVIVGGEGGQSDHLPQAAYTTIGLTRAKAPGAPGIIANTDFGLQFHPDSKILAGMREVADDAVRQKVDGTLFCAKTSNDTRQNPLNPAYWIAKTGATGELVPIVGTFEREPGQKASGGNSRAPATSIGATPEATILTSADGALGLVDPGKLATILGALTGKVEDGKKDTEKVLRTIQSISETSMKGFLGKTLPDQITSLVNCGYLDPLKYLSKLSPANMDPRQDPTVTQVFTQVATNAEQQTAATIAKLVLDGYAGVGTIRLGDYDYHNNPRDKVDAKDREAGLLIGRILKLASLKKTSVMVYVITDGGVTSTESNAAVNGIYQFNADNAERSASFALVYREGQGRPEIRANRRQIGAYKADGSVDFDVAPKIADNPEVLTKAFVANYLALHGREGDLAKIVGDDPFGAEISRYLAFGKII